MVDRVRRSKRYLTKISVGENKQNERGAISEELIAKDFLELTNIRQTMISEQNI